MKTPPFDQLEAALQRLRSTNAEQSVTFNTDISCRTQTVFIAACETHIIAHTPIADSDAANDQDLLDWSARYPGIFFRFDEGFLVAYVQLDLLSNAEAHLPQLERLSRVADRLEFELVEGEDRF